MQLVSYEGGFGRLDGDQIIPMGAEIVGFLADGADPVGRAQRTREGATAKPVARSSVHLWAPVPRPGKIVCVGLNYRDHAAEAGATIPTAPVLFGKWANSVAGPGASVEIPPMAGKIDYEGELAVIIGRLARRVDPDAAWDHVAGYTVVNDLSAREQQWQLKQWTRGKAIDGFLPMGPCLVTPDEIGDPHDLRLRTEVNGRLVQDSSTAQMIFGVNELISSISQTITLEPGDCIATGTPAGVGFSHDPPLFLGPGDEVTVEIDGIGRLTTTLVAEG